MQKNVISINENHGAAARWESQLGRAQLVQPKRNFRRRPMTDQEVVNRFVKATPIEVLGLYHQEKRRGAQEAIRRYILARLPQKPPPQGSSILRLAS